MVDYFGLYVIVCNILCSRLTVVTLFGMCYYSLYTDDDLRSNRKVFCTFVYPVGLLHFYFNFLHHAGLSPISLNNVDL